MIKHIPIIALFFLMLLPVMASDPITFSADSMKGATGGKNKNTILQGNAVVHAGSLTLSGSKIEIYGDDYRFIRATGGVTGSDTDNGFYFSAEEIRYDRELEYSVLEGAAVMEDTENKVVCRGGLIEYNKKNEIAVMQIHVRILKEDIACRAAYAVYNRDRSELELTGSPVVVRKNDEFKASRINVNLDTDEIVLDGRVSGEIVQENRTEDSLESAADVSASVEAVGSDASGVVDPDAVVPETSTATTENIEISPSAGLSTVTGEVPGSSLSTVNSKPESLPKESIDE